MYEFAYSAICDEPAGEASPPDSLKLADAIELFAAASEPCLAPCRRQQLLSDFRRLWLAIANDLLPGCKELSPETIVEVRSSAGLLLAEVDRRRFERSETELLLL